MTNRSLCIAAASGRAGAGHVLPLQASAAPGAVVVQAQVHPELIQRVGSNDRWHRRYYRDHGVYVYGRLSPMWTRAMAPMSRRRLPAFIRGGRHLGAGAVRGSLRPALSFPHLQSATRDARDKRRGGGERERDGDAEMESEQQDGSQTGKHDRLEVERRGIRQPKPQRSLPHGLDLGEEDVQGKPQA